MIRDFFDVAAKRDWGKRNWVVAGKGPSYDEELVSNTTFSMVLNHVARRPVDALIAHCVDVEAVCPEVVENAEWLLMPWESNRNMRRSRMPLHRIEHPVIESMWAQDRILFYNRMGTSIRGPSSGPDISVKWFSSEGAIGCLAACGVKLIRATGIDGGTEYSSHFSDLTPLENGHKDFDKQFWELKRLQRQYGVTIEGLPCRK